MCIKELRLVTGQLPEKSGLIGPGHKRTSPVRGYKKFARGKLEPDAADAGGRLTPPSQGRQYVLGDAVLAFREPLAQLADDRAGHTVALEPSEQLVFAGGELHALQVPTHLGGQALPQEIHGPSPPPLGRSVGSWY